VERPPSVERPPQVERRLYEGRRRRTGPKPVAEPRTFLAQGTTPTVDGFPARLCPVRWMRPGAGTGTLAAFLVLALKAGAMGA
jgi:hypothetical protein